MLVPIADKISKWRLEGRLYTAFEPEDHAVQYIDLGEWQAILTFGPARRSNVQGEKIQAHDQQQVMPCW